MPFNTSQTGLDYRSPTKPARKYSELSDSEKWAWHAETYAFRRVYLGVADHVRTSPCDPECVWFDDSMVEAATAKARRRKGEARSYYAIELEGRDICNRWAVKRGYGDFDAARRDGRTYGEVIAGIVAATKQSGVQGFKTLGGFKTVDAVAEPVEARTAQEDIFGYPDTPEAESATVRSSDAAAEPVEGGPWWLRD